MDIFGHKEPIFKGVYDWLKNFKDEMKKKLINQIILDYSNRGFIYLRNQIKDNGEYEIFIKDREWSDKLNKNIFLNFLLKLQISH